MLGLLLTIPLAFVLGFTTRSWVVVVVIFALFVGLDVFLASSSNLPKPDGEGLDAGVVVFVPQVVFLGMIAAGVVLGHNWPPRKSPD